MKNLQKLAIENIIDVQELAKKIWKTTYLDIISQAQIDYMLNEMYHQDKIKQQINENHFWFLIQSNQQDIGFTHFFIQNDGLFLSKIYILENFQGNGIGKEVLNYIVAKTKELNLNKIVLRVNKNNKKAITAYQKFGFKITKEDILILTNEYVMDDYIMEKSIK